MIYYKQNEREPRLDAKVDEFSEIRDQINAIDSLKTVSAWGAEFQLWEDITEQRVKKLFGERGLILFKKQGSVVLTDESYVRELDDRKRILEGLMKNTNEYKPDSTKEDKFSGQNNSRGGIFFEVGGDMVNHGVIHADKNSTVGIAVAGNYSSNDKTKITQGDTLPEKKEWYEKPSGKIIIGVVTAIIATGIIYLIGWN